LYVEQMTEALELPRREGREGNRWVNHRPDAAEVGEWFKSAIKLHEGMQHEDWVGGLTLIEGREETDEIVGFTEDNRPRIVQNVQHIVYIPYPKVETRIDYFNKLMERHEEEWVGFIEPVPAADPSGMTVGFNAMKVSKPDSSVATLICCTMRVRVLKRDGLTWEERVDADGITRRYARGDVVMEGAPGTKAVPLIDRHGGVNFNAVPAAQTGAIGRALGMVGILVIPGTGVATAEDMQESAAQGQVPGSPAATERRVEALEEHGSDDPDVVLRMEATKLLKALGDDHPEGLALFQAWAKERNLGKLSDISGPTLRGVVKKLEVALDEAQKRPGSPESIDIAGEEPPA
jgi:hypothetical protein